MNSSLSLFSQSRSDVKYHIEENAVHVESVLAEEQAGFRRDRSSVEQIFRHRVLCEMAVHQREVYTTIPLTSKGRFTWTDRKSVLK